MQLRFDVLAEAYDAMVDWDKRLAREAPFYRSIFQETGAHRVLDAACGSGRHAAMFASWGLEVVGADVNERMIEHCRAVYRGTKGLSFEVRSFLKPSDALFDVVVCGGNSLPLLEDLGQVDTAIGAMAGSVRPGGAVVIHILNLAGREQGTVRWEKCKRVTLSHGDSLIIKGTHVAGDHGYVNFLLTELDADPPRLTAECARLLKLGPRDLSLPFQKRASGRIRYFGSFAVDEFAEGSSPDLIVVANRAAT